MSRSAEAVAFPLLEPDQIEQLRELGREEDAPEGRILFAEGDRGFDLGKSMSRYLVDRIEREPDIRVRRHTEVARLVGDETLERIVVVDNRTGEEEELDAPALFVFIGAVPRTRWLGDQVAADSDGFVLTGGAVPSEVRQGRAWEAADRDPFLLETSVPGIFATGDVRSGSTKRVASAVGEGSTAVKFVHEFLARS